MARKKRGAQPNNTNALQHGFYSEQFKDTEIKDLDALMAKGLESEIGMMRVLMRRLLEAADKEEEEDINVKNLADILNTLGLSATRLAALLRTQKLIGGEQTETAIALRNAIQRVKEDWCLK